MAIKRILVVEDEDLIRTILAETLEDGGFTAVEASNAAEAIGLIDGEAGFDLVVTDVQMPGVLDGIAVGQYARTRNATIPVIYVTGRPDSVAKGAGLGPCDVLLRKPYGPGEVIAVINRMLRCSQT